MQSPKSQQYHFVVLPLELTIKGKEKAHLSQEQARNHHYKLSVYRSVQKFDESQHPVSVSSSSSNPFSIKFDKNHKLAFYVPVYNAFRQVDFILKLMSDPHSENFYEEVGHYTINTNTYIAKSNEQQTKVFDLTAQLSDQYQLKFQLYLAHTRFQVSQLIRKKHPEYFQVHQNESQWKEGSMSPIDKSTSSKSYRKYDKTGNSSYSRPSQYTSNILASSGQDRLGTNHIRQHQKSSNVIILRSQIHTSDQLNKASKPSSKPQKAQSTPSEPSQEQPVSEQPSVQPKEQSELPMNQSKQKESKEAESQLPIQLASQKEQSELPMNQSKQKESKEAESQLPIQLASQKEQSELPMNQSKQKESKEAESQLPIQLASQKEQSELPMNQSKQKESKEAESQLPIQLASQKEQIKQNKQKLSQSQQRGEGKSQRIDENPEEPKSVSKVRKMTEEQEVKKIPQEQHKDQSVHFQAEAIKQKLVEVEQKVVKHGTFSFIAIIIFVAMTYFFVSHHYQNYQLNQKMERVINSKKRTKRQM